VRGNPWAFSKSEPSPFPDETLGLLKFEPSPFLDETVGSASLVGLFFIFIFKKKQNFKNIY